MPIVPLDITKISINLLTKLNDFYNINKYIYKMMRAEFQILEEDLDENYEPTRDGI